MTTKPPLQRILQGILHTESESKQNHEKIGNNTKPQRNKVENNIYSAAQNQTPKQQRELNDRDHHISVNTNTEH
jgi:hypothetical protein